MSILTSLLKSVFVDAENDRIHRPSADHGNYAQLLYLDLMKRCLMNYIYDDDVDLLRGTRELDPLTGKIACVTGGVADPAVKYHGGIWPSKAHTMIGMPRLGQLQACIVDVLDNSVPGDFIETGVWRGGASFS